MFGDFEAFAGEDCEGDAEEWGPDSITPRVGAGRSGRR